MNNEQAANPAYRIYSVSRDGEKKAVWQEIGSAWTHKDGKGLNLNFAALPLEGAAIVLRVPKAKTQDAKPAARSSRRMNGRYDALKATAREVA